MVIGTLKDGGLFAMQIEGAQRHRTGLQIDITGTEGVFRITNPRAFENKEDNSKSRKVVAKKPVRPPKRPSPKTYGIKAWPCT